MQSADRRSLIFRAKTMESLWPMAFTRTIPTDRLEQHVEFVALGSWVQISACQVVTLIIPHELRVYACEAWERDYQQLGPSDPLRSKAPVPYYGEQVECLATCCDGA